MRVLAIAPQPFFSPRGTPLSVYYRTLMSAELGCRIDLLTYGEGRDVSIPGVRIVRIPRFALLGNVKVGPSFLKLFLDIFLFFKAVRLLLSNRYDFVEAHEEAVFFCCLLKPIFRFKLVYAMHSSLPQQLTNFSFTRSRILIGIFGVLENVALRSADAIITICEDLYLSINEKIGDKEKHILIENSLLEPICLSGEEDSGSRDTSSDRVIELPSDRKIVVYAGTLETYQGIDMALRALQQLVQNGLSDILFIIVGGRQDQIQEYGRLAEVLGLQKHCLFVGSVSRALAREYIERADVLISPRVSGTNTPLKVYELLASGKPIVATNVRSHTQVLNEDVAWLMEPCPEEFARGLQEALRNDRVGEGKAGNAVALYREKYSREVYSEKTRKSLELLK